MELIDTVAVCCLIALWPCGLVALWPCGLVSLWPCCLVFQSKLESDYKSIRFFDVCFDVKSIVVKRFESTKNMGGSVLVS